LTILALQTLAASRRGGNYVDGQYALSTVATFPLRASVQPIERETAQQLPEGARKRAKFVLYADDRESALRVVSQGNLGPSDLIEFRGESYELMAIGDWTTHAAGIPHREYIMLSVGEDE